MLLSDLCIMEAMESRLPNLARSALLQIRMDHFREIAGAIFRTENGNPKNRIGATASREFLNLHGDSF